MKSIFTPLLLLISFVLIAQNQTINYWQQNADYTMEIDMDVKSYQYKGKQKLVYTNKSPDVITRVYYHLYFDAFRPGSEMDIRLQSIKDPDRGMIVNLSLIHI